MGAVRYYSNRQAFFAQLNSHKRYAILYLLQDQPTGDRARRLEKRVAMLEGGETIHPPTTLVESEVA